MTEQSAREAQQAARAKMETRFERLRRVLRDPEIRAHVTGLAEALWKSEYRRLSDQLPEHSGRGTFQEEELTRPAAIRAWLWSVVSGEPMPLAPNAQMQAGRLTKQGWTTIPIGAIPQPGDFAAKVDKTGSRVIALLLVAQRRADRPAWIDHDGNEWAQDGGHFAFWLRPPGG